MPQQIIVIDDSSTVREQVAIVLGGAGYEILEAEDGMEGAALIRRTPTASLAICDINMPKMGGLDMLDLLQTGGGITLPIMMLTTEGRPDLIERARSCGARGWMVKPFKATMLLATVKKLIQSKATP